MTATSVVYALAIWCGLSTVCVLYVMREAPDKCGEGSIERILEKLPLKEKVGLLIQLEELKIRRIPWYQKAISTLGVIAFVSMSAAAFNQTINSQLSEIRAQNAELKAASIQAQERAVGVATEEVAKAISEMRSQGQAITVSGERVIYNRINNILSKEPELTPALASEAMTYALAVGDVDCAGSIFRKHDFSISYLNSYDSISVAEFLYLIGDTRKAEEIVAYVLKDRQRLRFDLARRAEALRIVSSVVDQRASIADAAKRLARGDVASIPDIEKALLDDCENLRKAKSRTRVDALSAACKKSNAS